MRWYVGWCLSAASYGVTWSYFAMAVDSDEGVVAAGPTREASLRWHDSEAVAPPQQRDLDPTGGVRQEDCCKAYSSALALIG